MRLVLSVLLLLGCSAQPDAIPDNPSFSNHVLPILTSKCASCHAGSSASGNYDLTSYTGTFSPGSDSIANVIAGQADSSVLYRRITGADQPQMPIGAPPLDSIATGTIRNWIDRGAQNN